MKKINLGDGVDLNLETLLRTRMLIQANSGGGKSWLIRRLLEQTHGKVQQIIIDLEGEFLTLRERFDYVVVGKSGDIAADKRTAPLLVERLMEIGASAIIDLSELKKHERPLYLKVFLEALMELPKKYWHPLLVLIDECHQFASQTDKENESRASVIDVATRGRKRGFCLIAATQRIAKVHKDLVAELLNRMIGRTGLDIDVKRASDELGFTEKTDRLSLRSMTPGDFYAFGPALTPEVRRVKIGSVLTTHPEVGSKAITTVSPPSTETVKKILSQLQGLPKEAEEKRLSIENAQKRIRELESELRQTKKQPAPVDESVLMDLKLKYQSAITLSDEFRKLSRWLLDNFSDLQQIMDKIPTRVDETLFNRKIEAMSKTPILSHVGSRTAGKPEWEKTVVKPVSLSTDGLRVNAGARRMLAALVQWHPQGMTEGQMRAHAGLRKSGTYGTYKSTLKMVGLIEERDGLVFATEQGVEHLGADAERAPSTTQEVLDLWMHRLKGEGARRMLKVLVEHGGDPIPDEQLQEESELAKSGTYGTYKSQLRTAKLIVVRGNMVAADRETLFL
jgi:hypothetical protein